ncbi:MAG: hypothetical protein QOG37_1562, partial [Mycobacterium sp.]|nr:hypothetical protein [Mycobacterium sp.]
KTTAVMRPSKTLNNAITGDEGAEDPRA